MAQYGRPSADTYNSDGWLDEVDGVDIYQSIDEVSPSDADYIISASAPTLDIYVTKLTTMEDPVIATGHIVRYRYQKDAAGGSTINLIMTLYEGYVNEGAKGTLIATEVQNNISNGWVTGAYTLSAGEANSITDYTDLAVRLSADQP